MKHISKSITESIIGKKGSDNIDIIADIFLKFFGSYLKKPEIGEIALYIDVDKSHYTGQDFQYDFAFVRNDIGTYRKIAASFANAINGNIYKESSGFKGGVWYWDPETIIEIPNVKFYIGRRLGNRRHPKDISNTTYISISNKMLWMKIYEML